MEFLQNLLGLDAGLTVWTVLKIVAIVAPMMGAVAEQYAEYDEFLGGSDPASVVHMCGSGVTACHNLLAMEAAGLDGARLYAGSWSEWCADPARFLAQGDGLVEEWNQAQTRRQTLLENETRLQAALAAAGTSTSSAPSPPAVSFRRWPISSRLPLENSIPASGLRSFATSAPTTSIAGSAWASATASSSEWTTVQPGMSSACRVRTTFVRPGSGRPSERKVLRPITTGWPVVTALKCRRSSEMCHSRAFLSPITPFSATATMMLTIYIY